MKTPSRITFAAFLTLTSHIALAQETPGPSPTASYGCEPHGDHWHCDGPITASATITPTSTSRTAVAQTTSIVHEDDHHEEHEHEIGTKSMGPSPTESVGCVAHGDHYHCDGPVITPSAGSAVNGTAVVLSTTTGASPTVTTFEGKAPGDFGSGIGMHVFGGMALMLVCGL